MLVTKQLLYCLVSVIHILDICVRKCVYYYSNTVGSNMPMRQLLTQNSVKFEKQWRVEPSVYKSVLVNLLFLTMVSTDG